MGIFYYRTCISSEFIGKRRIDVRLLSFTHSLTSILICRFILNLRSFGSSSGSGLSSGTTAANDIPLEALHFASRSYPVGNIGERLRFGSGVDVDDSQADDESTKE